MATRFVRVDLSAAARDYRPIAIEPGMALLDPANTHSKILLRWLGRLAAEPEWEQEAVGFYVRDDAGGRLEDIVCQPATREDLDGPLKDDLAELKDRLARAKAETPAEQALLERLRQSLGQLLDETNRTDLDSYFFRYRDATARSRLVWCWGFQRSDGEPAPAVVCTDPDCNLLFVRRPKQSPKCPSCALLIAERNARRRSPVPLLALLVLLILLGLAGWWWEHRPRITVTPENLNLVVGEVADLRIDSPSGEPILLENADATVADTPNAERKFVFLYELPYGAPPRTEFSIPFSVVGREAGSTALVLRQGKLQATVPVTVTKGEILALRIEPAKLVVPANDTMQPKVIATVKTATAKRGAVIASDRLTWEKQPSPRFAVFYPKSTTLAGISPTTPDLPQTLAARFDTQLASAPVEVTVPPLTLVLYANTPPDLGPGMMGPMNGQPPIKLPVGEMVSLGAYANYQKGGYVQIPLHLLKIECPEAATGAIELRDGKVIARKIGVGPASIFATYYGNKSNTVVIQPVAAEPLTLDLQSKATQLHPGDTGVATLVGKGARGPVELAPDQVGFKSSDEKVLAVDPKSGSYHAIMPGEATIAGSFAAAKEPARLKFTVSQEKSVHGDRPTEVRILSDQGKAVKFPVGAVFDDFRVEAQYADGYTRVVTKQATITTPQSPQESPVAVEKGQLHGVRPGQTQLAAQFEGVDAKEALGVEVVAAVDADELRVDPSSLELLRGETVGLRAIGYKNGKSIGNLGELGNVRWQSSDPKIARADGAGLTGVALGKCEVTATLGPLVSKPAAVSVVDSIAGGLKLSSLAIKMRVGESVEIGRDITVTRAGRDVSRECEVGSTVPEVVEYLPESHSLLGVAPGVATVAFTAGDKIGIARVDVLSEPLPRDGRLSIEPAAAMLAPGQSQELRVFLVAPGGSRIDATSRASLTSADPAKVKIIGGHACAVAPGEAAVTATLPGGKLSATAHVTVNHDEITALSVEPGRLDLGVGDRSLLHILGTSAGGTHELFPQGDLHVGLSDGSGQPAVRLDKECASCSGAFYGVSALRPGEANVSVAWRDKLAQQVPVTVGDAWTDLRIEPPGAAIRPGGALAYQVTAVHGGSRRPVGPENGLKLTVDDPKVARVVGGRMGQGGTLVRGQAPGRTTVTAQLARQTAEATLDVAAGAGRTDIVGGPGHVGLIDGREFDPDWFTVPDWVFGGGDEEIVGVEPGAVVVPNGGYVPGVVVGPGGHSVVHVPGQQHVHGVEVASPAASDLSLTIESPQMGENGFDVGVRVQAAQSGGRIEYRVYEAGKAPPDHWVAARDAGELQEAQLRSPRLAYGQDEYHLVIEARSGSPASVTEYQLRFKLKSQIEKTK